MSTGIYKIKNLINGKSYIGKSEVDIEKRWRQHKRGKNSNAHLQNAFKKYGIENFEFTVLEYCEPEKCADRERYWISHFNTMHEQFGYNQTNGGEGISGFKMSKEATEKAKNTRKKNYELGYYDLHKSEETKQKLKDTWKKRKDAGYKMSEETKRKLSISHKKENLSKETLKRMSEAQKLYHSNPNHKSSFYGKHHTEEAKRKQSLSHTGFRHSEESKIKMSKSRLGKNNAMYGKRGELCPHFGKKAMHDVNGNNFYVKPDEIESYLKQGYILGKTNSVNDNIRKSKFKYYYIYDNKKYLGENDIIKHLRENGYPTFSSSSLKKICQNCIVRGYEDLTGKIKKVDKGIINDD